MTRRTAGWLLAALLLALVAAPSASAEDPRLGEPWEEGILAGILEQDRGMDTRTAEAILQEARSRAQRPSDETTRVVRLYLLARAFGLAKDQSSARQTYAEVLRLAPRCYVAFRDLGILDTKTDPPDRASAERNFQRALAVHPRYTDAMRKLALLYIESNRAAEAVPLLDRVVTQEPSDLAGHLILARVHLQLKRYPDAQREIALLRSKDSREPSYRILEADLFLATGDRKRAKEAFRQLATENPSVPAPLNGYLQALEAEGKASGQRDPEEYLWALERLQRIEKDPKRREELRAIADDIRKRIADQGRPSPEGPSGPPTDADVLRVVAHADPQARIAALRYVYAQEKAPTLEVLRAVMQRLGPEKETAPTVRQWALRVLGRFGGPGLVGLVRHSTADPDPSVPPVAVDALVGLAEGDPGARGAAILVLGPLAGSPEPTLSTAARHAILRLANAEAEDPAAFSAWWAGPVAGEAKIRALETFARVKDLRGEEVVGPYLDDPDPLVVAAAARALADVVAAGGQGARGAWLRAFPGAGSEPTLPPATLAKVRSWWAARPR